MLIQGKLANKTKFKKKTINKKKTICFSIFSKKKEIFVFMWKKPKTKRAKERNEQ
jgi:hypothetical protein